ncbi:sigma-54 dependent transcriptional regulator [Octadecabacter sp. 1_MG-2023]|uniref:sigma-54-dependent transcriptional regulator n=1 Tax=unclassified Octadecabacter TaxID=196158 RepID=UPI001C09C934|nr:MULTISPECIES: sigma-54 dependent transcriptional regulator [unclassified Octadecabacter]MBU2993534.1 sigma-54 dependent transcriptional regulator [Octadecabacter sp. B2R22]MDO6735622.1 sigma-54 dependent transcriptional regulator [Octadecabacter sp. 1_MG-2023]
MNQHVLIVDDERDVREALGQTIELADLVPVRAGSFVEAKDHITPSFDGVIITDIRMPGRDGFHLLDYVRQIDPDLPVILLTGEGDIPMAVKAMSDGAYGFLEKPCGAKELLAVVQKAIHARSLVIENRRLKVELNQGDAAARMLVGVSQAASDLRNSARTVARASAEVLITGEPGTGTPKIAEVIHLLSGASNRPFVKRPAAQLSADALLAAIEEAESGTLYLDEVTALAPAVQFALLEMLESGSTVRVLAGTTRDIQDEVGQGRFSTDLFYRLDLMRVHIPALRDRPEDIPVLFRHYVGLACEQANLPVPEINQGVIAGLMAQDWPGNARGLMNAAMRFSMGMGEDAVSTGGDQQIGLAEQLAQVERSLLIEALQRAGGRSGEAAGALKLPRKTFYDKLARHGIKPESYRN